MLAALPLLALPLLAPPLLAAAIALRTATTEGAAPARLDRRAFLVAAVVWGALTMAGTEALSALGRLDRAGIAGWWLAVDLGAALLVAVALRRRRERPRLHAPFPEGATLALGLPLVALLALTLVTALAAPPNTVDSLTYHLPRVVHWLQDRGVDPYPTHIPRQVFMPPFAEYAILGLRALAGDDRWANLVQWLAAVGCAVAASEVARGFGLSARGQWLAAVLAVTSPMAVAQASSTKNDLVLAFWAIALVALARDRGSGNAARGALLGAAAGLALATKLTAYVLLAPFLAAWAVTVLRRRPRTWGEATAAAVVAALLVTPGLARNLAVSGSPFGPVDGGGVSAVTNAAFTPATAVSNAVRNAALHAPLVGKGAADRLTGAIRRGLAVVGIDADDPATTFFEERFALRPLSLHEERAGSPWQALALAAAGLAFALRRPRPVRGLGLWGLVVAGALLFCLVFKWQVWNARLHLPLFVLGAPAVAAAFDRSRLLLPLGLVALLGAFPAALAGEPRPLLGADSVLRVPRDRQYFAFHPETPAIYQSYRAVANYVAANRIRSVGLFLANNHWEYPLWVFLGAPGDDAPTIRHVEVAGDTARLREPGDEEPVELVLWLRPPATALTFEHRGRPYVLVLDTPILRGFRALP